jgi:hypothetical protein
LAADVMGFGMLGTVCAMAMWSCAPLQAPPPQQHMQLQPPVRFVAPAKPLAVNGPDFGPSYLVIAPEIQIGRYAAAGRSFRFSVAHMSGGDFYADDVITGEDWVRAIYRFHS